MEGRCRTRGKGTGEFQPSRLTPPVKPDLGHFHEAIELRFAKDPILAERARKYQHAQLRKIGADKLRGLGFRKEDIQLISDDDLTTELTWYLLPDWIREFLFEYWASYLPWYRVSFYNDSDWSHDFVVAYETGSGLINIAETSVGPRAVGTVTPAPCWDMVRYAWSAWNPDDNVEVIRAPTLTVEEINEQESVQRPCEDTWDVRITYQ